MCNKKITMLIMWGPCIIPLWSFNHGNGKYTSLLVMAWLIIKILSCVRWKKKKGKYEIRNKKDEDKLKDKKTSV